MLQGGLIRSRYKIGKAAQILRARSKIKAGKYLIPAKISSYRLLHMLVEGKVVPERVTIPEGLNSRQIAAIVQRQLAIDSTEFVQLVSDSGLARELGIQAPTLEGFLFPDTYRFNWGVDARTVITILVNQFKSHFDQALQRRASQLGMSLLETVTLASIIEGEAVVDSERVVISAVYHNRLKQGMRLQADPTIQYIIKDGPRRLLSRDLKIDSPYNTYKYTGLPPGPINNPGLASIKASLFPARVDYLYFVANGDGSHTFSATFAAHLRAKARFDKIRRAVKKRRKEGLNAGEKQSKFE